MNRLLSVILALALMLSLVALCEQEVAEDWNFPDEAAESTQDEAEDSESWTTSTADATVGGWTMTDLQSAKGDEAMVALFEKAVEGLTGVVYTPAAVLATQVVSGTNYCILAHCDYTESDTQASGWALMYIYEAFGGEVQLTNVVDIDIPELADYGLLH